MQTYRILIINLGSTSTKLAYCENDKFIIRENLTHEAEEIMKCPTFYDQYDIRITAIEDFLVRHDIKLEELDAISSRSGQTEPVRGGTYRVNLAMIEQNKSGRYANHINNIGPWIAYELCKKSKRAIPYITDATKTDEMEPLARYSGLKEIPRISTVQALNIKAMSKYYAEQNNKKFEDLNLVIAMLGGGISVLAMKEGKMIDCPDGIEGEGPFCNNRCLSVPIGPLVKLCYSGKYDLNGMMRHINGEAGLIAYLGTTNIQEIMTRIENGDEYAKEVMEAMCYQTAKEIGAMATVLKGDIDAILIIGGMANVPFIVDQIKERVSFIAPIAVLPGEREMEALAEGAYEALTGKREVHEFIPKEV